MGLFIAEFLDREEAALVTDSSIDAMTSAVESLLSSPELRAKISSRGEFLVQNSLNIETVVVQLSKIYGESLEERVK
jgi:glycosyltransferase involved in cell wall biosynthesis